VFPVADLLKGRNRKKVFAGINVLYPLLVMVPDDKMFFAFQTLQIVLRIFGAEYQITNNINGIVSMNTHIPVINQRIIHFGYILKGTVAMPDDISVPKMKIACKINHVGSPRIASTDIGGGEEF
jgi:hypothetical protein